MLVDEYRRMYEAEETHFWFRGTRAIVLDQLRGDWKRPLDVVDVGCGTGGTLRVLPVSWKGTGVDVADHALTFARTRGHFRLVQASAMSLPFDRDRFDLALALDVIEHCSDDAAAARELCRVVKPGGLLVATVPAFQALFGPHDVALAHYRRYRRPQLCALLRTAGFDIEKATYFNTLLFAPTALMRLGAKIFSSGKTPSSDANHLPAPLNELLFRIFVSERSLIRKWPLPAGLSILAVARKPLRTESR
jgi:SAM-dependent methyltransferase